MVQRRLMFDITPAGLIGEPFRKTYRDAWKKLRRDRIKTGNLSCDLCSAIEDTKEHLPLHEVYTFPSPDKIRLDATQFLCRLCHDTIHFERTRAFAPPAWVEQCAAHYCMINDVSEQTFEADRRAGIQAMVDLRDAYKGVSPRLDYGPLAEWAAASEKRKEEFKKIRAQTI